MERRLFCLVAAALAGFAFVPAQAEDKAKEEKKAVLEIGAAAPEWTALPGADGEEHSLKDLEEKKAVVVIFTCNHCPVAVQYEDRLVELQKDYAEKGVQVVAINTQDNEADNLDAMKQRAETKGFNFQYLFDASEESGKAYGAMRTPEVFLLDAERKVAYKGAIDDNNEDASKVEKRYLRDAIDAVLAGSLPETTTTKAVGCGIRYKKK
jgi:peroxiredoxin